MNNTRIYLMNNTFNPHGEVTRAEFGTALSRALYGDRYE